MGVALDHRQALPPAELLDRAQVYPSHDEPGGESVPVPMPRVRVQVPVAFPSASGTLLARSMAAEKNFVWPPVRAQGKTSSWGSSGRCRCVAEQGNSFLSFGMVHNASLAPVPSERPDSLSDRDLGAAGAGYYVFATHSRSV